MKEVYLNDLPELITPDDLAGLISPDHQKSKANIIRRQCLDGVIPAVRIGKRWYISRDEVLGSVLKGIKYVDK